MEKEKTKTEEIKEDGKDLAGHVGDFLETYYQLLTLNLAQKAINIASAIINSVILAFLGLLFICFLGLGVAWWLGTVVGSRAGGFFITAGIYLLAIVVLVVMREKLIFPLLRNIFTRKIAGRRYSE